MSDEQLKVITADGVELSLPANLWVMDSGLDVSDAEVVCLTNDLKSAVVVRLTHATYHPIENLFFDPLRARLVAANGLQHRAKILLERASEILFPNGKV